MEPTTTSPDVKPATADGKRRKLATLGSAAAAPKQAKESKFTEVLHEIFRSQGMDLRESERTRDLMTQLSACIGKGGN